MNKFGYILEWNTKGFRFKCIECSFHSRTLKEVETHIIQIHKYRDEKQEMEVSLHKKWMRSKFQRLH